MTMVMPERPDTLLDSLRGDRGRRPRRDEHLAGGVRTHLEDRVYELVGPERRATPLTLSAASLRSPQGEEIGDATLARARGVLVSTVLRLLVARVHVDDPFDDALSAWRAQGPADELLGRVEALDRDQLARLRSDVRAHVDTLRRGIGIIPSTWTPRSALRSRVLLAGGTVLIRDVVDLVLGSPHSERASVALIDVTSSPLSPSAERVVRFHALVQTLRSGVVPLRSSIFSSATGEAWTHDVDAELLWRAAEELSEALARAVAP